MQEQIRGLRQSLATVGQRLLAPKTHLGSEAVNVLQVLCDLIDLVEQMNTAIAVTSMGQHRRRTMRRPLPPRPPRPRPWPGPSNPSRCDGVCDL